LVISAYIVGEYRQISHDKRVIEIKLMYGRIRFGGTTERKPV
jgi:hypothetical protein